ncbi:MAG TPA: hypothetical protein DD420_18510 [Streptomyces sp.]|nr:hypothetical protein [Streptomyces sp.]
MTRLLKDYLAVAMSDNRSAARKLAEQPHIRKLGYYDESGKIKPVRELLTSGDLSGSNLIQSEVKATVVEGANHVRAFMDALPIDRTKGTTLKWPYGQTGVYAKKYPQTAEIEVRTEKYGAANYDASEVIAERPVITDTMIEAGQVNMIEQAIRFAGEAVMNSAEQICLSAILENSGVEHDTAGSDQGLKAVSKAVTKVKGQKCMPDFVILHPDAEGICMQDVVIPTSPGADAIARGQGIPDGYLGLKWRVCSVDDAAASYTWGYGADGNIGMLVLDSSRAGGIYMPRDLTVKDYEDPIRDMTGMTVTMRMDSQSHIANAACRVEF